MATLLEKVNTLVRANLNALVDDALDRSSVAIVDQHIRDAERHVTLVQEALGVSKIQVERMQQDVARDEQLLADLNRRVDQALTSGDEQVAVAAQTKVNAVQARLEQKRAALQRKQDELARLEVGSQQLREQMATLRQERGQLQRVIQVSAGQKIASEADKKLEGLAGSDEGDSDVSRVVTGIRERLDVANARLAQIEGQSAPGGEMTEAQADQILERASVAEQLLARKKQLGMARPAPEPAEGAGAPDAEPSPDVETE